LPQRYGSFGTVASRFYRWRCAGLWQRILEALQARADRHGRIDWSLHLDDHVYSRYKENMICCREKILIDPAIRVILGLF
jgi:hypothetical protein